MIRLHDYLPSGNGYKVRLILSQLGVPFERIEYDIYAGDTRTPDFLGRVNPNGRIPVLETDDGEFLAESNAILVYLAEGTRFMPEASPEAKIERAKVFQWMFFEQYSHEPNIATPRSWLIHNAEMTEGMRKSLRRRRKLGYDALGVMERHLEEREFFVGERYTIADIALFAYTHVAGEGGFDLEGFSAIRAWLERVASQPDHIPITQT